MVKIAVVQSGSVIYDTPATLQKLRHFVEKAAHQKADLVLFPGKVFIHICSYLF
jgi:predicted amidohydrolase